MYIFDIDIDIHIELLLYNSKNTHMHMDMVLQNCYWIYIFDVVVQANVHSELWCTEIH